MLKETFGIFLDLYCFDNIPDNELLMKLQAWRARLYGKLLILYWLDEPVLYFGGLRGRIVTAICRYAHVMLRKLNVSPGVPLPEGKSDLLVLQEKGHKAGQLPA